MVWSLLFTSEPFRHGSEIVTTGGHASLFSFLSPPPSVRSPPVEIPFVLQGSLERVEPCGRHAVAEELLFAFITCELSGSKGVRKEDKN